MDHVEDVERLFSWLKAPMVHYREFAPQREVAEAVATWPIAHRAALQTGIAAGDEPAPQGRTAARERIARDSRSLPTAAQAIEQNPPPGATGCRTRGRGRAPARGSARCSAGCVDMPVVCFASPKGGVGRTTLAATIGVALHRLGWRVVAIDLDRQNALRLNFELPEDLRGVVDELESGREWNELAVETPAGIFLVPFGAAAGAAAMRAHTHVAQNPGWLRQRLTPFLAQRDLVVGVDMPPGPSAFNVEPGPLPDLPVIVLLAD